MHGKQGRQKDKYQGCTPNKTRRTKLFATPREAAVALAELKQRGEDRAWSGVDDAAADVLALCWALGLTSAGGFTRAGGVTMEAEAAKRVMRSVVAPRTSRTSHGREARVGERRVGVLGPAIRSSFGGKAPPGLGDSFLPRGLSFLRKRSFAPPPATVGPWGGPTV